MEIYTDQTGYTFSLDQLPRRIISLVPSQTELLWALGLDREVAGITRFCIDPPQWLREKVRVGGTKDIHSDRIDALAPDLILANKEENDRQQVMALRERYPVWTSDIPALGEALSMIKDIGRITGREVAAAGMTKEISQKFAALPAPAASLRIAYLVWQEPLMVAGGDTFIHDMISRCGWINIFADRQRYPVVTPGDLQDRGCEVLLLSSEPYPFREKHADLFRKLMPGVRVLLADGKMFSWYGSRLLKAPGYFATLAAQL